MRLNEKFDDAIDCFDKALAVFSDYEFALKCKQLALKERPLQIGKKKKPVVRKSIKRSKSQILFEQAKIISQHAATTMLLFAMMKC